MKGGVWRRQLPQQMRKSVAPDRFDWRPGERVVRPPLRHAQNVLKGCSADKKPKGPQ